MNFEFEKNPMEELNKKWESVRKLVEQLDYEETKIMEFLRNTCAELRTEVAKANTTVQTIKEALNTINL